METIVIKLDPQRLANADLDIRYILPDRIEEATRGAVVPDGYDYLDDGSLGLWLAAASAGEQYPAVISLLREEDFLGNALAGAAEVYISAGEGDDIEDCRRVYPGE